MAPENREGLKKQSNSVSTLTFPPDHCHSFESPVISMVFHYKPRRLSSYIYQNEAPELGNTGQQRGAIFLLKAILEEAHSIHISAIRILTINRSSEIMALYMC